MVSDGSECFGSSFWVIAQAESAVKDAQEKGLEANQALKERQEAPDKLNKNAAQNKKEVKEAMAKVRAEGRAGSAPAAPSRRLQADLDAGVHPRAAKKADKDRQRATERDRTASWKRFERSVHGQANPEKWDKKDLGDVPEPQSHTSWNLEEDIWSQKYAGQMRLGKWRMKPRCLRWVEKVLPHGFMIDMKHLMLKALHQVRMILSTGWTGWRNDPQVRRKLDKVLKEAFESRMRLSIWILLRRLSQTSHLLTSFHHQAWRT